MLLNNTLDRRQAHSGSFELRGRMQPLKNSEELLCVLHVEADSVVPNDDDGLFGARKMLHINYGEVTPARKFQRVGEQIHKDQLHEPGIPLNDGQRADAPVNLSTR